LKDLILRCLALTDWTVSSALSGWLAHLLCFLLLQKCILASSTNWQVTAWAEEDVADLRVAVVAVLGLLQRRCSVAELLVKSILGHWWSWWSRNNCSSLIYQQVQACHQMTRCCKQNFEPQFNFEKFLSFEQFNKLFKNAQRFFTPTMCINLRIASKNFHVFKKIYLNYEILVC
jgi:hypothetical protein